MSGHDEMMPVSEALRSWEWAMLRLAEARAERDRYRDWFERTNEATAAYITATREALGRSRWQSANEKRSAMRAERIARARTYKAAGLSVPRIGVQMGHEDGRAGPYPEGTVRRWLKTEKGHRSSK